MFSSPEFLKIAQKITPKGTFKLLSANKVCQLASRKLLLLLSPWYGVPNLSTTLPRGHELRGEFSALTRTISPTARFLRIVDHFCLLWSRGKYSLDHLFQKISARYCTCLHLRREKESSFWNNPGGI